MQRLALIFGLAAIACAHGSQSQSNGAGSPHVVVIVEANQNFMTSRTHASPPGEPEISPDAPPAEPANDLYPELGAVFDRLGASSPKGTVVTVLLHHRNSVSVSFHGSARTLSADALGSRSDYRSRSGQALGQALSMGEQKLSGARPGSILVFGSGLDNLNFTTQTALQRQTIALCSRGLPLYTVYLRGDNSTRRYGLAGHHVEAAGRAALLAELERVFRAITADTATRACPTRAIGRAPG